MENTLNILNKIIDNNNNISNDNFILALTMYINFYYETIVCEEKMMNYLVYSKNLIDKLGLTYPEYTRRQLESMYIALTICMIFTFINNYNNLDLD